MSDVEQGTGAGPGTGSDRRAFLKKMAVLGGGAFAASTVMSFALDGSASAAGVKPIGGGGNVLICTVGAGGNTTVICVGGGSNGTIGGGGNLGGGSNGTIGGHDRDKDDDDRKRGKDDDDRKRGKDDDDRKRGKDDDDRRRKPKRAR